MFQTTGLVHTCVGGQAEERAQLVSTYWSVGTEISEPATIETTCSAGWAKPTELTRRETARAKAEIAKLVI
jgi:hypothetical protein